jgi:hypothetical protein
MIVSTTKFNYDGPSVKIRRAKDHMKFVREPIGTSLTHVRYSPTLGGGGGLGKTLKKKEKDSDLVGAGSGI